MHTLVRQRPCHDGPLLLLLSIAGVSCFIIYLRKTYYYSTAQLEHIITHVPIPSLTAYAPHHGFRAATPGSFGGTKPAASQTLESEKASNVLTLGPSEIARLPWRQGSNAFIIK